MSTNEAPVYPVDRWKYQYQRIADVLQQVADKLTADPHERHRHNVRADGSCTYCEAIKKVVDAAPPLTSDQISVLRALLPPLSPERRAELVAARPRLRSLVKENSK